MNVLLQPGLLTESGLSLRRQVGYALSVFVGCLGFAGLIALVVTVLH
jgi:hypothetical protein